MRKIILLFISLILTSCCYTIKVECISGHATPTDTLYISDKIDPGFYAPIKNGWVLVPGMTIIGADTFWYQPETNNMNFDDSDTVIFMQDILDINH